MSHGPSCQQQCICVSCNSEHSCSIHCKHGQFGELNRSTPAMLTLLMMQFKEHLVVLHLVLHLAMAHLPRMVVPLSMLSPSLPMEATLATPQQQQHLHTRAMVQHTHSQAAMVVTHKSQRHLMADSQGTVEQVLVAMIHMVLVVSKLMEALAVMASSQPKLQHSHPVVDSGRNCRTMRAGHTTITRSLASANGIVLLTYEQHSSSHSSISATTLAQTGKTVGAAADK